MCFWSKGVAASSSGTALQLMTRKSGSSTKLNKWATALVPEMDVSAWDYHEGWPGKYYQPIISGICLGMTMIPPVIFVK